VDTFILTGYSSDLASGLGALVAGIAIPAFLVSPRFASLTDQPFYLAQSSEPGRGEAFYAGDFDPKALDFDFQNEGTVALGELVTFFYGLAEAPAFTGNVLVLTGNNDAICCAAVQPPNCGLWSDNVTIPAMAESLWPAATHFDTFIPQLTGHSPDMHRTSQESFAAAHSFLAKVGF
jgi:hypothetical protein